MDSNDPNPDRESVERRLAAVERALATDEPLEYTDRLDDLEGRVVELEAAVQALRGYVGSVRAVNDDIEQRADLALRKATALERHIGGVAVDGNPLDGSEDTGSTDADDAPAGPFDRLRKWP
ncbi:MAG: DUF7310 family coiled-coil domain-containing protein [Natronomonas sp.]